MSANEMAIATGKATMIQAMPKKVAFMKAHVNETDSRR